MCVRTLFICTKNQQGSRYEERKDLFESDEMTPSKNRRGLTCRATAGANSTRSMKVRKNLTASGLEYVTSFFCDLSPRPRPPRAAARRERKFICVVSCTLESCESEFWASVRIAPL
ncbi:hypothetical protein EVAR_12317_1 [Eumeta japonica]|uniref:Uncharacterized protein n=1 Tax=Eumeta variegata TaxID=151549 RepID=A0A4C1TUB4_EUMVA|nr:hypothetical protein EVAR_12317_1 [Eumeta japonica]